MFRNLKQIIQQKGTVRLLEAHNPLCGSIIENSDFDGMWSSSLTDSASMALPDCEVHSIQKRLDIIQYTFNATSKPLLMDVDSGGNPEQLAYHLKAIQRMGISGVVVEDKVGFKQNSLIENVKQQQDTVLGFSHKLKLASDALQHKDFLLVARIESLILGETVKQALNRADAYINNGANSIMIHSTETDPVMLMKFVEQFKQKHSVPLVIVPTTYNTMSINTFRKAGVDVVIYANHLLRASVTAMTDVANRILIDGMSANVESEIISAKELIERTIK